MKLLLHTVHQLLPPASVRLQHVIDKLVWLLNRGLKAKNIRVAQLGMEERREAAQCGNKHQCALALQFRDCFKKMSQNNCEKLW